VVVVVVVVVVVEVVVVVVATFYKRSMSSERSRPKQNLRNLSSQDMMWDERMPCSNVILLSFLTRNGWLLPLNLSCWVAE